MRSILDFKLCLFGLKRLDIKRTDFVVDVGGGANPHWRADIIVEKFFYDQTERGKPLLFDRPLVLADAENMPFKDKSVDYAICRHVIEHTENIKRFISELERTSKAGWIECPTEFDEITNSKEFHNYVINQEGSKLICKRKGEEHINNPCFDKLKKYSADKYLRQFIIHNLDLTTVMLEWKGRIDYEVFPQKHPIKRIKAMNSLGHEIVPPTFKDAAILKFERIVRFLKSCRRNIKTELEKRLCCPACKKELIFTDERAICNNCNVDYKKTAKPLIYNFLESV